MIEIDIELFKAKKRVKDIKKLKRLNRKLKRAESSVYKTHPYFLFIDLIDCFIDLIKHYSKENTK